mmetsp:Transcript_24132/g.52682  ORF Transcript_24132/g.52682 Transcript_24132/m.52682 type:complete len:88 (-) Transcript_24132:359-622(-)
MRRSLVNPVVHVLLPITWLMTVFCAYNCRALIVRGCTGVFGLSCLISCQFARTSSLAPSSLEEVLIYFPAPYSNMFAADAWCTIAEC